MATNNITYNFNLKGNAFAGINELKISMEKLSGVANHTTSTLQNMGKFAISLNNIFSFVRTGISSVTNVIDSCQAASRQQIEAETKLAQVMKNTMGASREEYQSILDLASAQQQLGVVGDEVQLAGAQKLGTFLKEADSIKTLLPIMNDMVAQQYGYNATQESAVGVASLLGKAMEGNVGALTRYGYTFTEAQEKVLKFGKEEDKAAVLAAVVSQKVGGVNQALAETPEGKMQQVANRIGDVKERAGKLFAQIKETFSPLIDTVLSVFEGIAGYIETHKETIMGFFAAIREKLIEVVGFIRDRMDDIKQVFQNLTPVFQFMFGVLNVGWTVITFAIRIVTGVLSALAKFITGVGAPAFIALGVAVGIAAAVIHWQDIVLTALIAKEKIVTFCTNLWSAAQTVLNFLLTANPIGIIIVAIGLLIGIIIAVCSKIKGWGTLWDGVCGFIKHSAIALFYKLKSTVLNFVYTIKDALDEIKIGWYKFKDALGLGDSSENAAEIRRLEAGIEERQKALAEAAEKAHEEWEAAKGSMANVHLEWKTDEDEEKEDKKEKSNNPLAMFDILGGKPATPEGKDKKDDPLAGTLGTVSNTGSDGGKIKNITVNVNKLVERLEVHTTTLTESTERVKEAISEALLNALNDVNLAVE